MRGVYGNNQLVGAETNAEPVKLSDVSAGAGMWLGFFAFIGWSVAHGLSTGIDKAIEELRKPRSP